MYVTENPNELTKVDDHQRLVWAALALILHLVVSPERFNGLRVSPSRRIYKVFGMITSLVNKIHVNKSFIFFE